MDDREKDRQAKMDAWYASFDNSEKELTVFHSPEHEEEVRVRLLNKILSKFSERRSASPESDFRRKRFTWLRVAAVFAFVFLAFPLYNYLKPTAEMELAENADLTVSEAGIGEIVKLRLSDGSEISLNAGSVIHYPEHFTGDKREVYLEGEAFFEVAPDPGKPFIVHTGKISTRVLGTSFNVRAYPAMEELKVTVTSGKVGIASAGKSLSVLYPNEQLRYQTLTDQFEIRKTEANAAAAWQQGEVRLDGVSFQELSVTIKNTWGYVLETGSTQLQAASYKATFQKDHSIEDVMRVIGRITDATYRISNHTITLNE